MRIVQIIEYMQTDRVYNGDRSRRPNAYLASLGPNRMILALISVTLTRDRLHTR